jgi:hypothetical protein
LREALSCTFLAQFLASGLVGLFLLLVPRAGEYSVAIRKVGS